MSSSSSTSSIASSSTSSASSSQPALPVPKLGRTESGAFRDQLAEIMRTVFTGPDFAKVRELNPERFQEETEASAAAAAPTHIKRHSEGEPDEDTAPESSPKTPRVEGSGPQAPASSSSVGKVAVQFEAALQPFKESGT